MTCFITVHDYLCRQNIITSRLFVAAIVRNSVKQWISVSLLGLILVKVWVIPLLYLDFEIRREYIVANLCENKNRPQMHCDGKCYLAKRIASLDEQEKRQAEKTYISRLIDQVMDQRADFSFTRQAIVVQLPPRVVFSLTSCFTPRIPVDDIFHPPLV
ncbi:hypothetical protein [Dyadobacter sp. 50-39]|uniref:hypothetical protein n=1 Tax=Dyadobacter sp. 50-39 TaxID=1895756 RepID=UPI000B1DC8EE|nr:hypothetical protein [Dyadobacter sp. 50-39]